MVTHPQDDQLGSFVGISVGAHIALVLLFTVKAAFFPSEPIQIKNTIRVDIVGLPDKKIDAPPAKKAQKTPPQVKVKPKPKTKPKPKPKPKKPKVNLKKAKNKQNEAINKLKAMEALNKIESDVKSEEMKKNMKAVEEKFKGNVVNAGDSLSGLNKIAHDKYFATIKAHVQSKFEIPQWLSEANLKAQALVFIDGNGIVTKRELVSKSGNSIFDAKVIQAIDAASPFPSPPSRLKNVIALRGLILNFPD